MQDERRLAERIAGGDAQAFAEFVDRYGAQVHRLVRRSVPDAADAEDVTQEVFVDLYRGMAGFRGASALTTWVYRITLNHCLKHTGRARPETVLYDDAFLEIADSDHDPARHAARRELSQQVEAALRVLSPEHEAVVILHEMHGLTYGECAAALHIPEGTVKSRLSHAFRRLRVHLAAYVLGESGPVALPAGAKARPEAPQ